MALGGANIGWDESSPADSESAALGNERIQSIKTSVRQGLDSEHVWSSSGGTVGAHRAGSARAHVGLQSAVSSGDTDGRMMWTSDTSRLFHVGSSGKNYIGGARALSLGSTPAIHTTHQWVEEVGVATNGSSNSVTVTLPSAYSGAPFIFTQVYNSSTVNIILYTYSIGNSSFSVFAVDTAGVGQSGITFTWRSIGSRVI